MGYCDLEKDVEISAYGTPKKILAIFVKNKIVRKLAVQEVELAGS